MRCLLEFELELLCRLATNNDKGNLQMRLERLLGSQHTQAALRISLAYRVAIDVSGVETNQLQECLNSVFPPHGNELGQYSFDSWKGLTDDRVLDLVFLGKSHRVWRFRPAFKEKWINELCHLLTNAGKVIEFGPLGMLLPPAMIDGSRYDVSKVEAELKSMAHSIVAPYLLSLIQSMQDRDNATLYEAARGLQLEIGIPDESDISVVSQLGRRIRDKGSASDVEKATKIMEFDKNELIGRMEQAVEVERGWVAFFFERSVWPNLEGYISEVGLAKLTSAVPIDFNSLFSVKSYHPRILNLRGDADVDMFALGKLVSVLTKTLGSLDEVASLKNLGRSVTRMRFSLNGEQANELLQSAMEIELDVSWVAFLVSACSVADGVNVELLRDVWVAYNCPIPDPLPGSISNGGKLVNTGERKAIELGAQLVSAPSRGRYRDIFESNRVNIAEKYCGLLLSLGEGIGRNELVTLLKQSPVPDELEVWIRPKSVEILNADQSMTEQLAERFGAIANRRQVDQAGLRLRFGALVENRLGVPLAVRVAALDAILRLDELAAEPLAERDWID